MISNIKKEKGAIMIYLVMMVLVGIFILATSMSYMLISQREMTHGIGISVKAYQAADTGLEYALWRVKNGDGVDEIALSLGVATSLDWMCGGANEEYWQVATDSSCDFCLHFEATGSPEIITKFKSIGRCGDISRAIEASGEIIDVPSLCTETISACGATPCSIDQKLISCDPVGCFGGAFCVGGVQGCFSDSECGPDITPPGMSAAVPVSGFIFGSGTSPITIGLNTNESFCKYNKDVDTAYGLMSGTFATTGGTVHRTDLFSLVDGNYTYYVRCIDHAVPPNETNIPFVIQFDVGVVVDTTSPIRSNGAPTGTLSAGTTETNISLDTDEAATCKWEDIPGIDYGSMTNIFSTTGGISHSTQVTGLTDGNAYIYYIRCSDILNNENPDDWSIQFDVGVALNTLGESCLFGSECVSPGICADSVCCDSVCNSSTCETCGSSSSNGIGYCGYVNSSSEDPDNECAQGSSSSDGCMSDNCSGSGYSCGAQTSGDGGCPVCGTCSDSDIVCEYHPVDTYDAGCSTCYGCSGAEVGSCTNTPSTNWNAGLYGCTGADERCFGSSCRTCSDTATTYLSIDSCSGCAGQGGNVCWRKGVVNQSCDTICSNASAGSCVPADWDDNAICSVMTYFGWGGFGCAPGGGAVWPPALWDATAVFGAWFRTGRAPGWSQDCSANIGSTITRICVCDY